MKPRRKPVSRQKIQNAKRHFSKSRQQITRPPAKPLPLLDNVALAALNHDKMVDSLKIIIKGAEDEERRMGALALELESQQLAHVMTSMFTQNTFDHYAIVIGSGALHREIHMPLGPILVIAADKCPIDVPSLTDPHTISDMLQQVVENFDAEKLRILPLTDLKTYLDQLPQPE